LDAGISYGGGYRVDEGDLVAHAGSGWLMEDVSINSSPAGVEYWLAALPLNRTDSKSEYFEMVATPDARRSAPIVESAKSLTHCN
jgi:hypothetical protein